MVYLINSFFCTVLLRVQKYIQKIGFIILILWACKIPLHAQEMQWSNPIRLKGGAIFPKVIGENSSGVFLMRYRNRSYTKSIFLERYNSDLNLDLSLYVDLKNAQILKVQLTPKGILIVKSKRNKADKNYIVTGSWLSFDLKSLGDEITLFTHSNKHPVGSNSIQICMNDSLSQLMVSRVRTSNNTSIIATYLFDQNFELIQLKDYRFSYQYQIKLKDLVINNRKTATLYLGKSDQLDSKFQNILMTIRKDTILSYTFADSITVGSASLVYNRSDDVAQFVGFYRPKTGIGYVGIVFSNLDSNQLLWDTKYRRFDPKWLKSQNTGSFSLNTIAEDFSLKTCVPQSDGGLLIIAEQKDISSESDIYIINGISQSTAKNIYKFNEILSLSYDNEYHPQWRQRITKNQITINDGGYFSSAALFVNKKYTQLLYNDQFRNSGEVVQYTMYNTGQTNSQKLIKTELDYLAIIPDGAKQVSSNTLIVPTYKNRRFSLLKLIYN